MTKKYYIKKLKNLDNWKKFEQNSPQSNIFSSKEFLEDFKKNIDLYSISKGSELKCLVYFFRKDNEILSDPVIYSGILFGPQKNQKNCRYIAEKFNLKKIIIEEILGNYSKVDFNLHYNVEDIRPFLWFNYNLPNKPKFIVDVRYTALINLKNKTKTEIFNDFDDVKQRDIKKCTENLDITFDFETDLYRLKKFYIDTMNKNNGEFSKKNLDKMIKFMEKISLAGLGFQTNVYFKSNPIYSIFFSTCNNVACYLYGAGDVNNQDRISGTFCLWRSIENCLKKKIQHIDLEGVNSPNRGSFKITFGSFLKTYYNLKLENN